MNDGTQGFCFQRTIHYMSSLPFEELYHIGGELPAKEISCLNRDTFELLGSWSLVITNAKMPLTVRLNICWSSEVTTSSLRLIL